jgi:hypothetical protein
MAVGSPTLMVASSALCDRDVRLVSARQMRTYEAHTKVICEIETAS